MQSTRYILLGIAVIAASCNVTKPAVHAESVTETKGSGEAIFAGGCFWCMEPPFAKLEGVSGVVAGYTGGEEENPSYEDVSYGRTGHREAIRVQYDTNAITYTELLEVFWRSFDPTDARGQFADRGSQYEAALYYSTEEEKITALQSKKALEESGRFNETIVTPILEGKSFYVAENYHQNYYLKNPKHYYAYKKGSGRGPFLESVWGASVLAFQRPDSNEIVHALTDLQYQVTQNDATEPPFDNAYWDNKEEGIYVDIVSGEPLFASSHKFESGTGWPSFTQPLVPDHIVEKADNSAGMTRTEVRSLFGDSHLGHVFSNGPQPYGLRYCINSAALAFIARDSLTEKGYDHYNGLFNDLR
jgi:peptide methionine sulfoxide reductase msrA/msrB